MKKFFASLVALFVIALPMAPAFAQDPSPDAGVVGADEGLVPGPDGAMVPVPVNTEDPGSMLTFIVNAANSRQWQLVASGILLLLAWLGRLILPRLPKSAIPWVVIGLAAVFYVGTAMAVGHIWWKALLQGITVALASGKIWDLIGDKILPVKKPEEKPADPPK